MELYSIIYCNTKLSRWDYNWYPCNTHQPNLGDRQTHRQHCQPWSFLSNKLVHYFIMMIKSLVYQNQPIIFHECNITSWCFCSDKLVSTCSDLNAAQLRKVNVVVVVCIIKLKSLSIYNTVELIQCWNSHPWLTNFSALDNLILKMSNFISLQERR